MAGEWSACDHRGVLAADSTQDSPSLAVPSAAEVSEPANKLYRRIDGRALAGVAAGIGGHLRVPVLAVRLAFLGLMFAGGVGLVLYAVFWALLPANPRENPRPVANRDVGQLAAFVALTLAVLIVLFSIGLSPQFVLAWCLGIVAVGASLIWHKADPVQRKQWAAYAPRYPWLAMVFAQDKTATIARLVGGGVLVTIGLIGFLVLTGSLTAIRDGLLFGAVLLLGAAIAVAPWLWGVVGALRAERRERIRSQERAEIAAIVHDQVLHTLALIQRNSDDAREVTRLARGQERELRNWLYKPTSSPTERIAAALEADAAEVEDTYAVSVDAVVVGDCDVDERLVALTQAAREALVNAGKHAKVANISLYAEVETDQVSVFVRDRGAGFDLAGVDDDRHGVRGSILGRMKRHGGKAEIRSAPGEGTEVRLTMQRGAI